MFFRVGTVLCISAQTTLSTSMRKGFAAWSMSETCFPSWGIESKAIQVNRLIQSYSSTGRVLPFDSAYVLKIGAHIMIS